MSKDIDVCFRPEWDMVITLNTPDDMDIKSEKWREHCYDQLTELTKEELLDMFMNSLAGGWGITQIVEV